MAVGKYIDDKALIGKQFRFYKPEETVENLFRSIPDSEQLPNIVGYYDETPAGGRKHNPDYPYVWCCHCQKPTHWKGFVVSDPDQRSFLIGNNCGQDHYGADFTIQQNSFKDQRARQNALLSLEGFDNLLDSIRSEIERALYSDALKIISLKRDELNRIAGPILQKLRKAMNSDGQLSRNCMYRDTEAENTRIEKYNQAIDRYESLPTDQRLQEHRQGLKPEPPSRSPIYKPDIRPLGQVEGINFISPSSDLRAALIKLKKEAVVVEEAASNSEDVSTRELSKIAKKFRDQCRIVDQMRQEMKNYSKFFNESNLNRMSEWSKSDACNFDIRSTPGAIFISLPGKPEQKIDVMDRYDTPLLETVASILS